MSRSIPSVLCAVLTVLALSASAQDKAAVPVAAATPAVQSVNIQDVKPDASDAPGYADQTNAERAKVQPGNNAPVWRDVGKGVAGYSSLPKDTAPEAGVLIQPFVQYPGSRVTNAGEAWRQVRNQWLIPYGGALLLIVAGAIAVFFWRKGAIAMHGKPTGREIERFTPFERSAHWANAIAFVVLAISGLTMAFGKFVLQPIIGDTLFGWLTYLLKNAHNFAGPLFAVSLVVVFITFLKDNMPRQGDLNWLLKGGGILSGHEVPSHRFNAGEKLVFWGGVFFLGAVVVASGFVLDKIVPGLIYERGTMQVAHMVHAVATVLMMAMFMGHIYIGTIGMDGAYKAMKTGYVDETWAKEHHELWYDDIQAGKIPAHRSPEAPGATAQA
ncbi:formate dehydrogenase subunit gamma [Limnohabitans sp.]|uniref:formate dehydrogenase subunit gamma n=1 Tax=Limnohabitans sp. TaxID=1907725 RepID=UPI0038B90393